MQQPHFTPMLAPAIEHPNCAVCGTRMWLARIEPDVADHDRRTFECPQCGHARAPW